MTTQPQMVKEKEIKRRLQAIDELSMNDSNSDRYAIGYNIKQIVKLEKAQTRQDTIKEVDDIINSYIKGLKEDKSGMSRMIKNDINLQIKIIDCVKYSIKEKFGTGKNE